MMTSIARRLRGPAAPLVVIAVCLAVLVATMLVLRNAESQHPSMLDAQERVASTSVTDWLSVADAVVVARVTDEKRQDGSKSETATGDGWDLVGRDASLSVDKVLWQADEKRTPPSGTFAVSAAGWFSNGGDSRETAFEGGSRLEVGHSYVLALVWVEQSCDAEKVTPAHWAPIGTQGALPADDEVIGSGEYEGQTVERVSTKELPAEAVLVKFVGQSPSELGRALQETPDGERVPFQLKTERC